MERFKQWIILDFLNWIPACAGMTNQNMFADYEKLKLRLVKSRFRSSFTLKPKDLGYINKKGLDEIRKHAEEFIRERLAPASPKNDGRQTPFRGHPVFIAQHATATCCRGCLEKWHQIPKNQALNDEEIRYIIDIIMSWIRDEAENKKARD
jgi:exodeoxyribonuclease V alpha subunit